MTDFILAEHRPTANTVLLFPSRPIKLRSSQETILKYLRRTFTLTDGRAFRESFRAIGYKLHLDRDTVAAACHDLATGGAFLMDIRPRSKPTFTPIVRPSKLAEIPPDSRPKIPPDCAPKLAEIPGAYLYYSLLSKTTERTNSVTPGGVVCLRSRKRKPKPRRRKPGPGAEALAAARQLGQSTGLAFQRATFAAELEARARALGAPVGAIGHHAGLAYGRRRNLVTNRVGYLRGIIRALVLPRPPQRATSFADAYGPRQAVGEMLTLAELEARGRLTPDVALSISEINRSINLA